MSTTSISKPAPERMARVMSVAVGSHLDLEELGRVRSILWTERTPRVHLDLCRLHTIDPDAALLLHEDLLVLAGGGVRVRLLGASGRVQRALRRHPLRRFLVEEDDLFTDPDSWPAGFRPSRH